MADRPETLAGLIAGVRRRWMLLACLSAFTRAAAGSVVLALTALVAYALLRPGGLLLVALAGCVIVGSALLFILSSWALRRTPGDLRIARFIEEQVPGLDDSLVTAVEFQEGARSALLGSLLADANRRAALVGVDQVISRPIVRRGWLFAGGAAALLLLALVVSRTPARLAFEAASVHALPWRVAIEVAPGNARVQAGRPVTISVRLSGAGSVLNPVLRLEGENGRDVEMKRDGGDDRFSLTLDDVRRSFTYRVEAGALSSPTFTITALRPPRVSRIDLRYNYPAGLGLASRTEQDSGDIYAPPGTRVQLRIQADKPIAHGELTLADGARLHLTSVGPDLLEGELKVAADGSYRVSLGDGDGLVNEGETEYFIRTLYDRPPEVRILNPGADRKVTQLDEVAIEAHAEDDYGIERFDLVYSVRGREEKVVPFTRRPEGAGVSGSRTLFLEELAVQPGDFVTYYARARDVAKGRRSTEGRSDIFFLEVKPYDEEFTSAESQAMRGGANSRAVEELATAQKEIIIATWKLDRRSVTGRSRQDILSVAGAQGELRERVMDMLRQFNRFGRRPTGEPGRPPDQEPMNLAAQAMGAAQMALEGLKTSAAIPPEMDALNQLLKAEAEVRRRQVARQQSTGGGSGGNRPAPDLSALFDRELQRQQETNYETPNSAADDKTDDDASQALDKIRELARRQDELGRQQQTLAKEQAGLTADELKRRLERLTREQSELRRQAEELSRQLARQQSSGQQNQPGQKGEQAQQGREGQQGQQGQKGQPGQQAAGGGGSELRDASEEMRGAASDLRRQDPGQASARSDRALEKLRSLERQLQARQPNDRQRALGDLQLEARQLAESQRQVQSELKRDGQTPSADTLRRLAGEKERLADRVDRFERSVKELERTTESREERTAIGNVSGELGRQQIERRLRDSAEALRKDAAASTANTGSGQAAKGGARGSKGGTSAAAQEQASGARAGQGTDRAERRLGEEQELTRALERVAERMGGAGGERDSETRQLSEQLARTKEMRERLAELEKQVENGRAGSEHSRLQEEYARQLQQAQGMVGSPGAESGEGAQQGGRGGSPEKWEPSVSAPGTEAFKQDFAQWEVLRRDVTLALERLEASLSSRLQEKETRDRLSGGTDDRTPDAYRVLVDEYFRSLASKSQP